MLNFIYFVTYLCHDFYVQGREASFSALASAPLFAAKIPVGIMSGLLLQAYVPEPDDDDERCNESRAQIMWLIIALVTMYVEVKISLNISHAHTARLLLIGQALS